MDVIGDMAFGLPMGFLQKGNDSKEGETRSGIIYHVSSTISSIHRGVLFNISLGEMGSYRLGQMVKAAVRAIPRLACRLGASAGDDFENICIHQLRRRMEKGPPSRPSGDFMDFILNQNASKTQPSDDEKGSQIPFGELVADSNMMMNAGSDTTAAALSSTLYHLLSNPHCLEKLRHEVDEQLPFNWDETPENAVSAYSSVSGLPYLRACIDETLRLRPPIAFQLPRLVHSPEGATISGHHIRQGTIVAVSPYTIHRNKDLYPDADTFNPDRWLDQSNPEQLRRLKTYTIPFSQGSRACIGRHIAIVELQIMISTLVRRYDMSLSSPDQLLEIFDRFNANPGPLPIRVKRRLKVVNHA
jgi:benzoate 4-monooxygenase